MSTTSWQPVTVEQIARAVLALREADFAFLKADDAWRKVPGPYGTNASAAAWQLRTAARADLRKRSDQLDWLLDQAAGDLLEALEGTE